MTVTVYSKPNCMQCNFTKARLDDLGVEYEVRDITEKPEYLEQVQEMGYSTLPVIKVETVVGTDIFNGFQPDKLEELGA